MQATQVYGTLHKNLYNFLRATLPAIASHVRFTRFSTSWWAILHDMKLHDALWTLGHLVH